MVEQDQDYEDGERVRCNDNPPLLPEIDGHQICPNRITAIVDGERMKVPYCRNYPLAARNRCVDRAVVVIHGSKRNALRYYNRTLGPALEAQSAGNTIIIAPQFVTEEEIDTFELGDNHLFWSSGGWKSGSLSKSSDNNPRSVRYSSYSVVDDILTRLKNRRKFPKLQEIVVVGHSAGGQFVNRFAAGSPVEVGSRNIRYVVTNPSSYMYFTPERRVEGTLDQFAVPDTTSCPEYNEYKYGLDDLYTYMATTGGDQMVAQYPERDVVYFLGSEDNDPNSSSLDTRCQAQLQGAHRLERGHIYYNHVQQVFGAQITQRHIKSIVPGVGHSSTGMFASECGMRYLFDYNPNQAPCRDL
ncbi:MAG: alpha/beta hydrolase [Proteobacteria bacterium]|nr:alpha/beta hydrolase [Pseudomonadota bacterium]